MYSSEFLSGTTEWRRMEITPITKVSDVKKRIQERIVCLNTEKDTVHLKSVKMMLPWSWFLYEWLYLVPLAMQHISSSAQKEEYGNQIQLVSPFPKNMCTDFWEFSL